MNRILLIVPAILLFAAFIADARADSAADRAARAFRRDVEKKKADAPEAPREGSEEVEQATAPENPDESDDSVEEEQPEKTRGQKLLEKAGKEAQDGHIGRAYKLYERVAEQDESPEAADTAKAELESITATGEQLVHNALALDDSADARKKLSAIYKDYWQTPVREAISDARRQLTLRIAKKRAETGADTEEEEVTPGEDARMWLIVGDIHKLNDRTEEARTAYMKLIYEYPDSRYVDQARERLSQLDVEAAEASGE